MADDAEPQRADLSGAGTATSSPSAAPLARPEPAWPRATTVRATRFALQRDRTARAGAPRPLHPGKAAARRQSPARAGLESAAGPHGRLWLPAVAGGTVAYIAAGRREHLVRGRPASTAAAWRHTSFQCGHLHPRLAAARRRSGPEACLQSGRRGAVVLLCPHRGRLAARHHPRRWCRPGAQPQLTWLRESLTRIQPGHHWIAAL